MCGGDKRLISVLRMQAREMSLFFVEWLVRCYSNHGFTRFSSGKLKFRLQQEICECA